MPDTTPPPVTPSRAPDRRQATLRAMAAALVALALLTVFAFELADTQAKSRDDVKARVHERGTLAVALIDSLFESSLQQVPDNVKRYGSSTVKAGVLEANRGASPYLMVLDEQGPHPGRDARSHPRRPGGSQAFSGRAAPPGRPPVRDRGRVPYGKTGAANYGVALPTPAGRRILVTGFTPAALNSLIAGELRRIPGVDGAHNYLIDGGSGVVASTDPKRPAGFVFREPGQLAALRRSPDERDGFYYDQVPLSLSSWHLVLAAPTGPLFATVSGLRKWVPWAIFVAFALVALVAFDLGRRTLRSAGEVRRARDELEQANAALASTNTALARRAAQLGRSNDELDQFASIASHDLQEPLRKVRTFTQQLTVMEADRLSEKGQDYLARTNAAAERMQRLIEDLLRFSRVATQVRPFAPVDLAALTREVLLDLELEVARKRAHVTVGALPSIRGDAVQLRQLLQNLLSNALKFDRPDTPLQVRVSAEATGQTATLTVEDNGIGFEAQYAERIFRVFERLHGRGQYPGTGIGLALCRKIAERHGGAITAHGTPGAGARFVVTLPVDQREEVIVAPGDHREEPAYA